MKHFLSGMLIGATLITSAIGADSQRVNGESGEIKALSQSEIQDILEGNGMGYAKAAELNRHPGPRHVLDLAGRLDLSKEQERQSERIFDAMRKQAVTLGKRLVEKERELDRLFATGSVEADELKALLQEIATLQAQIRYAHLHAHVQQTALLTEKQIQSYDRLRGYGASQVSGHDHAK